MNDGQDRTAQDTPLASPELLGMLGSLLGSIKPSTDTGNPQASTTPPALSPDGLSALLSNPEMMERLPQMISLLKPMLASMPPPKPEESTPDPSKEHARDRLLLSLKPFLSKSRCDAIDTMLQISRLGSVFQQLK